MKQKLFSIIIIFTALISACAPLGGTLEVDLLPETQGATTETPATPTTIPPTLTPEPIPGTGVVMGKICFPSEFIPSMIVYFQETTTDEFTQMQVAENQDNYTFELESGEYVAFAPLQDVGETPFGGMYSAAVPCGLSVECTDHSLVEFNVLPGETTEGIDICDWYAPEQVPPAPGSSTQSGPYQDIAGLVYTYIPEDETWRIDAHGFPQFVYPERDVKLSPDGSKVLLDRDDDIWIADLISGEEMNLTVNTNRLEGGGQWWPANPEVIVFGSVEGEWGMSSGQASIMRQDGSEYQVLAENPSLWSPVPSPDGNTILYFSGEEAWLYHLDTGKELFNVAEFGLIPPDDFKLGPPSWSPDGTQLAWWMGGSFGGGEWVIALVVFDLPSKSFQFVHQYQPVGGGSGTWGAQAQWSPDGEWLAFLTQGLGRVPDLVVMRPDGSEFTSLGSGAMPLWSPDSSKLIFLHPDPAGGSFMEDDLMIVNREDWLATPLDLIPGSRHIQWGLQ